MVLHCSIPSCSQKYNKKLSFFGYPIKYPKMLDKWKLEIEKNFQGVNFDDLNKPKAKICHFHFEDKYLVQTGKMKRFLTHDAIPKLFGSDITKNVKNIQPKRKSFLTSKPEKPDSIMHLKFKEKKPAKLLQYKYHCRMCLKRLKVSESQYIEDGIRKNLELRINICLKVSDEYPNFMCKLCFKKLENVETFRTKILEIQEFLLQAIQESVEPIIKQEPVDQFSDPLENLKYEENFQGFDETENFEEELGNDNETEFASCILKIEVEDPQIKDDNECTTETDLKAQDTETRELTEEEKREKIQQQRKRARQKYKETHYQKVACSICNKLVAKIRLKSHTATFHDRKNCNYQCDICGSKFFMRRRIEKHVEIHMTCARFECKICGKSFKTSNSRSCHMTKIHKNPVNTVCDFCGKSYYDQNHLTRHIYSAHTKERNFMCDFRGCGRSFFTLSDKNYHRKKSHGPIKCEKCGEVCKTMIALKRHTMNEH